jgi:peptidyl-prolyl cis-trans isomerase SurA
MKNINSAIFLIAFLALSIVPALAQETEQKVVDEVVAQVNDGVITLSRVNREMKEAVDSFAQESKKPREQVQSEVEAKRGEMIANIINEELLIQKGKEMGVETDVEAQINQRFLDIMKQQSLKSLDALYQEMEKGGVDSNAIREMWRKQITRDLVLQREVDSKIYFGWTPKEIKTYFEANKTKFTKPETISISEIFLGFAGREPEAVKEKAKQLVAQARAGADFGKLAVENSDRQDAKETKGKVGTFNIKELDERFAKPLQNVKVNGISEPIEIVEGIEILRVDAKQTAGNESFFDENEVRKALTVEKMPEARKKYMTTLRSDAYININKTYRPIVEPNLFTEENKVETKKTK